MKVYFNELTLAESAAQNRMLLADFKKVWADFRKASEGKAKYVFADDETLASLVEAVYSEHNRELSDFLVTTMIKPYCSSGKTWLEELQDRLRERDVDYSICIKPTQNPECLTLGWAYLTRSITLGFESSYFWKTLKHQIAEMTIEGGECKERKVDVLCVTDEKHLHEKALQTWFVCQRDFEHVELPEKCNVAPEEKKIHYRDDHGREVLDAFARKLVRNPYVIGVVNSTEWHSSCDHFIYDTHEDGIVDVCLHWHDRGYGLAVKTTAKGKLQTMKVADVLEQEFDQGT